MSKVQRHVELMERSTLRLASVLAGLREDRISVPDFWRFLRRESGVHLKLSVKLWWMARRKKN